VIWAGRRSRRPGRDAVVPLVLLGLAAGHTALYGQGEPAGSIQAILDLRGRSEGVEITGPTSRVQLRPAGAAQWRDGVRGLPLAPSDRLRVEPRTVVRVSLRRGDLEATAHLTSNPEGPGGPFVVEAVGGAREGVYELRDDPALPGAVALEVVRGSLVLDLARGILVGFANGIRFLVSSTRIVVTVSEDGGTGLLHLVEGSVHFPDTPDLILGPGETALLPVGGPPALLLDQGVLASGFADAAEWSALDAWPTGGSGTGPWLWVGAAAGAVLGAQLIRSWIGGGNGSPDRSGTVIIRLPF